MDINFEGAKFNGSPSGVDGCSHRREARHGPGIYAEYMSYPAIITINGSVLTIIVVLSQWKLKCPKLEPFYIYLRVEL